jgi:hypothetical protein
MMMMRRALKKQKAFKKISIRKREEKEKEKGPFFI